MWNRMASSSGPVVLRLISASVSVANQAGKIIRDVMKRGDLGIVDKGINDLQTEADRSAQNCIVTSLSRQFPLISIIGEETLDPNDKCKEEWLVTQHDQDVLKHKCPDEFCHVNDEDIVVWVDPLDGTSEYTQGLLDHVTVLIGVAVKGKAVAGVIHQPFYNYQLEKDYSKLGRTAWGLLGLGAFGINHKQPPDGQVIITTTRSHGNKMINSAVEALKPNKILRVGGAGHKVLLVLEGQAHAYVFPSRGCKKWDTCAPEALLTSVGGKLTDIFGNSLQYHKQVDHVNAQGILATFDGVKAHNWFVEQIPDQVKASLLPSHI